MKKIISYIIILIIAVVIIWLYLGVKGQTLTISDFAEQDYNAIVNEFNITLSTDDKINSFEYMTYINDSFFVLDIQTTNTEYFLNTNKESLDKVVEFKADSWLFPTTNFLPQCKDVTAYYSDEHIYLSVWSYENQQIGNLWYELYKE